ncbi:MAG: lipoate--protein ligase family protein [Spirochaetales bacterium]|nr:lipoate--protein ligase family protein [Spirochaetales bacterium]
MTFLFYDTGAGEAHINMAIDEVLIEKTEPVLRFYEWKGTAITLGRFQSCDEINLHTVEQDGIPVIRRETGGKAVLHGNDLTISVILDSGNVSASVRKSILPIGRGIVYGLHLLGVDAHQVGGEEQYHASSYCFSTHSPYEVVVGMNKIAGIAMRRFKKKVLYQISIPLTVDIHAINKYFVPDENTKSISLVGIKTLLDSRFHINTVKKALLNGFMQSLDTHSSFATLTDREIEEAYLRAERKYNQTDWNFAR